MMTQFEIDNAARQTRALEEIASSPSAIQEFLAQIVADNKLKESVLETLNN